MDIVVIGNLTKDIVKTPNLQRKQPGGTAYYFGMACARLGLKTLVVTKLASKDLNLLDELKHIVEIKVIESAKTTIFENIYKDFSKRKQKVKAVADPFKKSELRSLPKAKIIHLGPLLKQDIKPELIGYLNGKISLDLQGYLREVKNQQVVKKDWKSKKKWLPKIAYLHADRKEAKIAAAKKFSEWGVSEVCITKDMDGALIRTKRLEEIPSFNAGKVVDSTGCGDMWMAAYLAKRLEEKSPREAGLFASAAAGLKATHFGPLRATKEEIYEFLNQKAKLILNSIFYYA